MKKLVIIMCAAVLLTAAPAWALPLALDSNPATKFQQTENSPCVIGNNSCNNGGFSYWSESGPGADGVYDLKSPTYTVVAGTGVQAPLGIPTSFRIGYDINYAGGQGLETLDYFRMYNASNNTIIDSWESDIAVIVQANGNGFSDAIFSNFTVLTLGQTVYFKARWINDTDGMEQFFIIPDEGATPVPEPMSLLLLGLGLVGLAGVGRFRK
jgi:hypothetical protein